MSTDQAFLDSLKPGDKFVLRTRRLSTFGRGRQGPEIYEVLKVPPKRSKFTVRKVGDEKEFEIKGHGGMRVGASFSAEFYNMEPHTPAIDLEIQRDTDLIKAKNRAYALQEQLRAFEDKANDLDPVTIGQFLTVTYDTKNWLNAVCPPKEK